jgi:hypothetical protein
MAIDDEDSEVMRGAIDDVLGRARAVWSGSLRDGETIVLVATLDDAHVRMRAPAGRIEARARDLVEAGWTVQLLDESERPIAWSPDDGFVADARVVDDPIDESLLGDADPPPLPDPAIDRLRGTT